ncbi:MAG: N-acetylmuramoyl-L-alanine amidase [Novosphingobium sp.]
MAQWKPIIGLSFDAEGFDTYCKSLTWSNWRPSFVAIHNTAIPNLAGRPNGFTKQHIRNLEGYYQGLGWKAGPHLFIDDKQIWVFTPLTTTGRHSPSWNNIALGFEMLGDYASDKFASGRGLAVRKNAVAATATICRRLGLDPQGIRLHKEDPATDHDCPGKNVKKKEFIADVAARMTAHAPADHVPGMGHGE